MTSYFRIYLGKASVYAQECHDGNYIGADYGIYQDLSRDLPENWRDFNHKFRDIWLANNPSTSNIAAGLSCGALHTVCKGILEGDIVLCPDGHGTYWLGEITGPYFYSEGQILPHRRPVRWLSRSITRSDMSTPLQNSTGTIGTVSNITKHEKEIESLIGNKDRFLEEAVEDPTVFGLEQHLEDFLIHNWQQTALGNNYDIYEIDGEIVGQQFRTDTGPIDILAISKDKKELLVVELKKGRASDAVIGQIQRYMGYVQEELLEQGQVVRGLIIALDDDLRIKRALKVAKGIDFYRYEVSFKLTKQAL